jgi:hypothetical protein
VEKTEEEGALALMTQLRERFGPVPPALATDGKGGYREALVEAFGQVPAYRGVGRPPTKKQPQEGWQYLQLVKSAAVGEERVRVVYGDPQAVVSRMGGHTAYIERTHLTSRQMNGRIVRKTLSFSKEVRLLRAACAWEDGMYNLTRPLKSLRQEVDEGCRRWLPRSPMMAAGLTDHLWTVMELLSKVVAPNSHQHSIR